VRPGPARVSMVPESTLVNDQRPVVKAGDQR
jgi:hypothetical protein